MKKIKINGKKVKAFILKNGDVVKPEDLNSVDIEVSGYGGNNDTKITGSRTSVIQGKNLISGSTITTKGDFHLGDK